MDGSAQAHVNDALERYRFAFQISSSPLLLVDEDGVILLATSHSEKLFDYAPGALLGQPVSVLVPAEVRPYHPELVAAFHEAPAARQMGEERNLFGVTRTGQDVPLEIALEDVEGEDGQRWVLATVIDLTERRRAEAKLRRALDASSSAMVMINSRGQITMVNEATCTMFGYSSDEMFGNGIDMLVPEPLRRRHRVFVNSFAETPRTRKVTAKSELTGQRKDGTVFYVEVGLTPIETEDGTFIMSTILDVSDQRQISDEINKKNADLERLNEELMQFAYSVSHDLKAPLTTVIGLLRFIEKDIGLGDLEEALENVRGALDLTERQAQRVENVLKLAKSDYLEARPVTLDLDEMIHSVWKDLTDSESDVPDLTVETKHAESVVADKVRMQSILENLLSNAVKYADPEKSERVVSVRTRSEDDRLIMIVADNGIGIPENKRDLVFKMFQRFSQQSAKGSGLGLAMVRKHVERMNGTIGFNASDHGTEFIIDLPMRLSKETLS